MAATYVYAIIPTGEKITFDVTGVGDDHREVCSIPHGDLAAVVSDSPRDDYRGLQREQAVHHLMAHQRVVEAAMQDFSVLPVKFGTVLPGEEWIHRLLEQGESILHAALETCAGVVQMEVVVLWDLENVFREIAQEEPIAELKAKIAAQPGADTMADKIALGQMVQASLQQRRAALQEQLLPTLREVGQDVVVNPATNDRVVLNVALLVDEGGREALEKRLELLDREFDGRFDFRLVGPLPPYSFATVEAQVPTFEALTEAREQLGVEETATLDEIKRAYRRLGRRLHPDVNRENPDAAAQMAEVTRAYELLQTVEGTLLITIRRQDGTPGGRLVHFAPEAEDQYGEGRPDEEVRQAA